MRSTLRCAPKCGGQENPEYRRKELDPVRILQMRGNWDGVAIAELLVMGTLCYA